MHGQRLVRYAITHDHADARPFLHANQRTGNLQCSVFDAKRVDGHPRSAISVGAPLADARFEANGQHTIGESAGGEQVVVEGDPLDRQTGAGRGRATAGWASGNRCSRQMDQKERAEDDD